MHTTVVNRYDIGDVIAITELPNKKGHLITTSRGKYTLRKLLFSWQIRRMQFEHAFTDFLADNGYPARTFVRNCEGNLLSSVGDDVYYLCDYFDGAFQPDSRRLLSNSQLEQAGIRLAELHSISAKYQGLKAQKIPFRSSKTRDVLSNVRRIISQKGERDDFDQLALEVVTRKLAYVSMTPFERQSFMDLPHLMNHGDFHAGNLIYNEEDRIIAVIDFEYCTDMPRIWDVVWAITWLSRQRATEAFSGRLDVSRMQIFLSSYQAQYPLDVKEREALAKILVSSCFHSIYFLQRYYCDQKTPYQLEKCDSVDEWLWLALNEDLLRDVINTAC